MNATIQTIPELLIQTRGNQTEVARMLPVQEEQCSSTTETAKVSVT